MTSPNESERPQKPTKPDDVLPPVQPPSSTFILQLFLIPMIIVSIIVCVWLMFSWLAHMGNDPQKLVQDIRKMNSASWQKALVLANMLRNSDYDHLKDDADLATDLSALLQSQLDEGGDDDRSVKLRRFLCRALGEFRTPVGMPTLLNAAKQEQTERDLEVRRSALAAITILSSNLGGEVVRQRPEVMETLILASKERGEGGSSEQDRAAIRSTAAFALGVIGGSEAAERLAQMTIDSEPDVRFNAAIGLARIGDARAEPILLEMLDPDNEQAIQGESSESARVRKRIDVLGNAIRAVVKLRESNAAWNSVQVQQSLQSLATGSPFPAVQLEAEAALNALGGAPASAEKVGS